MKEGYLRLCDGRNFAPTIAQRFNAGLLDMSAIKSRQGRQKFLSSRDGTQKKIKTFPQR
jgi:hypothetical protein